MGDFGRAFFVQMHRVGVRTKGVHCLGEAGKGRMATLTASQVQINKRVSCTSSTIGSHEGNGITDGRTSMVSGLPSASFRCAWKCCCAPWMRVNAKAYCAPTASVANAGSVS